MLTPELLERLRSTEGAALLRRAASVAEDPFAVARLVDTSSGTGAAPDRELAAAAVEQVRLRLRAAGRFSRAGQMWLAASLLEQASGEEVSRWRARRFARWERVGDLCCGLGGDTLALGEVTGVVAVDRDPLALALTRANAEALGLAGRVETRPGEVPEAVPEVPAAWIDPGRREGGTRTRSLERMSPSLAAVLSLRPRIPHLGIKLAPGTDDADLDRHVGDLPHEREFLSVRGECRELVVWTGDLARAAVEEGGGQGPLRRATLLPLGVELSGHPQAYERVGEPGPWLLEPDAAVIRAGLVGNLARQVGAWAIDPQLAYLSASEPVMTPFARLYRIQRPEPFSGKTLGAHLRRLGAGDVVIKTRGAAVRPEILRQQMRGVLKQGRPDCRPVVFITRFGSRPVMILGERFGPGADEQD